MSESEVTAAFLPPTTTFFTAPSPEPSMVSSVPRPTVPGENDTTVGATPNDLALVAAPVAVVTLMVPLAAAVGTVTVSAVVVSLTIPAAVPANATEVAPARLVPLMVTVDPADARDGVNDDTVGAKTSVGSPSEQLSARFDQRPWTATVPVASTRLNMAPGPLDL